MRLRALCLALLAPALIVPALLVPGAARAADEPAPDPMAGAPAVGDCADITLKGAYKRSVPNAAKISCDKRHTTEVVAVGLLPDDVSYDDDEALWDAVEETCTPAWQAYWGKDRLMQMRSLYVGYWFVPLAQQQEKGARWFRCDLTRQGDDALLEQQGTFTAKVTKKKVPASVGRCATEKTWVTVPCDKKHGWRHTGAFATDTMPKNADKRAAELRRLAIKKCPGLTSTDEWLYASRSIGDWRYVVVCLSHKQ
jgi:hypothetical protein